MERTPHAPDAIQTIRWSAIPGMVVAPRAHGPPGLCVMFPPPTACAAVFLDGVRIPRGEAVHFRPDDLEAIAVLRPREAAILFETQGGDGVALMWTPVGR